MSNAFSDLGRSGFGATQDPTIPVVGAPGPQGTFVSNDPGVNAPGTSINPGVNLNSSDTSTSQGTTVAPTINLASGIGQILLFPGKTIVSQFVGTGDPLDTSHLPITVLLSAAAWYAAYWWFFQRSHK